VPPRHYCVIENPVARDDKKEIIMESGQAKLLHADQEIRLAQVTLGDFMRVLTHWVSFYSLCDKP